MGGRAWEGASTAAPLVRSSDGPALLSQPDPDLANISSAIASQVKPDKLLPAEEVERLFVDFRSGLKPRDIQVRVPLPLSNWSTAT